MEHKYGKLYLFIILSFIAFFISESAYAQPNLQRATTETDMFGKREKEKAEKELKRIPQKPPAPKPVTEAPVPKEEQRFFIKTVYLVGCESYSPKDFTAIMQKYENRDVTMTEMNNLAKLIEQDYLKRGVIAAVFLPPQEVTNQTITLQVVEAKMGDLQIQKHRYFNNKRLDYYWRIKPGETLRYEKISKSIQMMNKNPDREVKAALHAGKKPGYTDIILTPETNFPIHGIYSYDREGVAQTGKERTGFGVRDNNGLGCDDSIIAGTSIGKNFSGVYGYHSIPVSPVGTSVLYGYSYSISRPKKDYEPFGLKSEAENITASIHQDLYKKDEYVGEAYLGFDAKDKTTFITGTGTLNRDRLRVVSIGGTYVLRGSGSVTYISPEFDQGVNVFGNSPRENPLASRAGTEPTYSKFTIGLSNRTALPFNLQENLKFKAQFPSERLLPQEQFSLGGLDSVRGYPPGDFLADKAILTNAELLSPLFFIPKSWRLPYAQQALRDQVNIVGFFDYGYGELRGSPKPHRMASLGAGLRMNFYDQVTLRLEWGFPIGYLGDDPITEGESESRFHISLDVNEKLPEEIARIMKEMEKEQRAQWAWDLVNIELNRKDSPLREQISNYRLIARTSYEEGRFKESKEVYERIYLIAQLLHKQAEAYIQASEAHEEELRKWNEEARTCYEDGKLAEAKKLSQKVVDEAKPKPLIFEY